MLTSVTSRLAKTKKIVADYGQFLDEFENFLTANEILLARTQGVGVLPKDLAINASITGPMLRAAGVNYDLRKVDKYGIYSRFDFKVPVGEHGDIYDRYMVRVLEMRESIKILEQALRDIPAGPVMDSKAKLRGFRPKAGEVYGRIEGPKGELGFYVISDVAGRIRIGIACVRRVSINLTIFGRHVSWAQHFRCRRDSRQRGHRAR